MRLRDGYKRPFDLIVLVLSTILLAPLFLLLWTAIPLAIWLADRGPVFYRQQRPGKNSRLFTVRKFRTMIPDADQQGPAWTTENDNRLTRVGKILRKTALDELPQLLNIWKGDVSFVGPRALPIQEQAFFEETIPGFRDRLRIRPGLTGLAQVYNQQDDANSKLSYDLEYIEHMSPWMDARLLVISLWNTVLARWDKRGGKPAGGDETGSRPSRPTC